VIIEKKTIYDIMILASENYDAVGKVWESMLEGTTLLEATIEWARRNDREIHIVDSKK
jgi:hypothetical protein